MGPHCTRALAYAESVISGATPACSWIRLGCQRQLTDLARESFDWRFDTKRAERICEVAELLPHIKGRWKSRNLQLEPWQEFLLTTLYGWIDRDGLRRFRRALIVVPRKNAKSTLGAVMQIHALALDGEPGAEVYSAATTRDQAKISWEIAKRMCERTRELRETWGIETFAHSILVADTASFLKPLSRDADTLEGLNVHFALVDELHAHPNREVFDVLDEATGSRRQPLIVMISTEGESNAGIFPEQVNYLQQILGGNHADDSYFGLYYGLDAEDDWRQPEAWRKANPNFGVSIDPGDFESRFRRAMRTPDSQASFLCKRFNVRVGAASAFFNMLAWRDLCSEPTLHPDDFQGASCIGFLDLASKRDLTAKLLLFYRAGIYYVFCRCYLPAAAIESSKPNYDFYRGWKELGAIEITPGDITDYEFVKRDILADSKRFRMQHWGYDPHQATKLVTELEQAGLPMVDISPSVKNFSEPMKELDALIVSGRIKHNGDPVLAWAMSNVTAKKDVKDNVYPRKERDENKIDPAVALIGALNIHLRQKPVKRSIFASRETAVI